MLKKKNFKVVKKIVLAPLNDKKINILTSPLKNTICAKFAIKKCAIVRVQQIKTLFNKK